MSSSLITAVLMLVNICSQIKVSDAVKGLGCQRSYNVQEQEFGVVYEYFHNGDDVSCAYEFRGEEGQRVMLAVSHIGLLPKQQSDDQCMPQLTITDVSPTGEETIASVICDDNDVRVKGSFVSSANVAKVTFTDPSDNGILLLQFWFVQDVKLIPKETVFSTPEPSEPRIDVRLNTSVSGCLQQRHEFSLAGIEVQCDDDNTFRPLQCSRWGQDISLSRCICVDKITGQTNALEPPYCLESPESFHTRCLQELAEIRRAISLKELQMVFYDFETYPPTCDSAGNYLKLQCRYPLEDDLCACVDPVTGNITNLAPPACEYPLPTEPSPTNLPSTTNYVRIPTCFVFFCTLFCESGKYAVDENGCQICACEIQSDVGLMNETCPDARRRAINETLEEWELENPSPPYSWIPECYSKFYTMIQENHLAGYFCVDQVTGKPNGKEMNGCDTYRSCVYDRTMGFSKALRKAGYKKTSKQVKALLSGPNANDFGAIWNLLNKDERENTFTKTETFVPRCNAYGDFQALQCNYGTGNCWCVDIFGAEIEGSRRSIRQQVPDCTQYTRRSDTGPVYVDDMYDFSFELNDDFGIYSSFENYPSSYDVYYFWTKDGVPVPTTLFGDKYSVDTWSSVDGQLTIGLNIYNATENDQGSYRCNLVKSSTDYFYSSPPSKAELYGVDTSSTVYDYYNSETQCVITTCDKVCAYGYKNKGPCPLCECWTRGDINSSITMRRMQVDIASTFGTNNGRCEAKRQWIYKNIRRMNLTANPDAYQIFDIPPECDSNGNFAIIQNITSVGRVCVDVMTGQPNGRMLPDCETISQCSKDDISGMKSHLNFFLDDPVTTKDFIADIRKANSVQKKQIMYFDSLFDAPTSLEGRGRAGLLPVLMCHPVNAMYYGQLRNFKESPEFWCVDIYGNEIEGTRAGVNETLNYCQDRNRQKEPETQLHTAEGDTDLMFKINSTIELPCNITAASIDAFVTWSTPKGYLEQISLLDKRLRIIGDGITDFTLRISNLNYSDQGWYMCDLSNYLSGYGGTISYYVSITTY